MKIAVRLCAAALVLSATAGRPGVAAPADQITLADGIVEGVLDASTGIRSFKGVPFAAPPTGDRRWKAPQPVENWTDVRKADQFGPRCMQQPVFGDMVFRSNGMSEDCLYLNVWTPASPRANGCRCWSTSTAAASSPATDPSRATTARAWRARASSR